MAYLREADAHPERGDSGLSRFYHMPYIAYRLIRLLELLRLCATKNDTLAHSKRACATLRNILVHVATGLTTRETSLTELLSIASVLVGDGSLEQLMGAISIEGDNTLTAMLSNNHYVQKYWKIENKRQDMSRTLERDNLVETLQTLQYIDIEEGSHQLNCAKLLIVQVSETIGYLAKKYATLRPSIDINIAGTPLLKHMYHLGRCARHMQGYTLGPDIRDEQVREIVRALQERYGDAPINAGDITLKPRQSTHAENPSTNSADTSQWWRGTPPPSPAAAPAPA